MVWLPLSRGYKYQTLLSLPFQTLLGRSPPLQPVKFTCVVSVSLPTAHPSLGFPCWKPRRYTSQDDTGECSLHSYKAFAQWIIQSQNWDFLTKTWLRKMEHAPPPSSSCAQRITFLSACWGFQATAVEASSLLLNFRLIKVGQIPFITAYFKRPSTRP